MSPLAEKVLGYIRENHMLNEGQKVVAGISGGADSMCLLFVLLELRQILGITVIGVHVNHGIRGRAADDDQRYVEEICRKYQVPCYSFKADIRRMASARKMSEEEAGRHYRYECFERVRENFGANRIAVAHHQDDCCETVLMNLFRGSGIRGLTGILPVRDRIIRPLLCVSRTDIEVYLKEAGVEWREDHTNVDTLYMRNRVRHELLPYIHAHINERAGEHIEQTARMMAGICDFLDEQTSAAFDRCVCLMDRPVGCLIREKAYRNEHPVIRSELIRRCMAVVAGRLKDIEYVHVELIDGLFEKYAGRELDLPYDMTARRTYEGVTIRSKVQETQNSEEGIPVKHIPGTYALPGPGMFMSLTCREYKENEEIPRNVYTKWFDCDRIKGTLAIRTRQNGDFIVFDEAGHKKTLNRFMIDARIPRDERDSVLLLADGSHILWVVGYRISEGYKITDSTKKVLVAEIKGEEKHGR